MGAPITARRSIGFVFSGVGLCVAALAVWTIVAGDVSEGPVVVELTANHGLHRGEVSEVGALVGGMGLAGLGAWMGRFHR